MNEIQNVDMLTAEILILKQQTAQNIIEIGKRLISVKESLPHGTWGNWLKEKVDFTERTAQRFMKVANEFSNTTTLSDLPKSKIFALLDLPQEEREEFIKTNPVEDMTAKELQQAIKEKKALEVKLKAAEKANTAIEKEKDKIKNELTNIENANKEELFKKEAEIRKLKMSIEDTKIKLENAQNSGDSEDIEKLQASLDKTQQDLMYAQTKIEELEKELKEKPIDVITAEPQIIEKVIEKVPDDVAQELQDLRGKLNQQPQPNNEVIKFKVRFEETINQFKGAMASLEELKNTSAGDYEKCKNAAKKLLNKMIESL